MGKATVLVVDDEFHIVDLLAEILEDEGYTVLRAYDGLSALALAEGAAVDLVIADVMMPRLDGISLAYRLRERDEGTRIVLMSAAVARVPPEFGFIAKPFDINDLLDKLAEARADAPSDDPPRPDTVGSR